MPENRRPKILQAVADGHAGGGTTFVLGLSAFLREQGFEVELLIAPHSYAAEQAASAGLAYSSFDFFRWPHAGSRPNALKRALAQAGADLVHVHGPRAGLPCTLSAEPRRPTGGVSVYTVHGYHFRKKGSAARLAGMVAEHVIQRRADAVVHVSAADAAFAQRSQFGKKLRSHVILNGVGIPPTSAPPLAERRFDVVWAGRLVRQKNPVFAAQVLRALAASGRQVALVGDGELSGVVKAALGSDILGLQRFVMPGALNHAETMALLADSRVLLSPSLWEGLPLTPMESMICGGVVVASNIEGNNEVIEHEKTGLLIDDFNVDSYVIAIQNLLKDPERLARMGQEALHTAQSRFAKQRCYNEYLQLYRGLLNMQQSASH